MMTLARDGRHADADILRQCIDGHKALCERLATSERALAEAQAQLSTIAGGAEYAVWTHSAKLEFCNARLKEAEELRIQLAALRAPVGDIEAHVAKANCQWRDVGEWVRADIARQLAATIRARDARIAALELNDARYRWLRDNTSGHRYADGEMVFVHPTVKPIGNIMRGSVAEHLDNAIDAALTQPARGEDQS